jgi:DNA-binding MarR family transcriptional regulator
MTATSARSGVARASGASRSSAAAPRTASKQRLRLWLRLLRAARAIEGALRERLRTTFMMTLPQFDVLAALARTRTGMSMTELSRLLLVSNGNVTGIIDRLAAEHLVTRQAAAGDRRAVRVSLTPAGIDRFAEMAAAHETWVDELLSEFTKADTEVLIAHLDGLAGRIRKGARRR